MSVEVDKPGKVLFPEAELDKSDVSDYYERISGLMLPHLKDRPLTLHRFPEGIDGVNFIQKHVPDHFPEWLPSVEVEKESGTVVHPLAHSADTLRSLVDQGSLALHVWLARKDRPDYPDRLIVDLDPPGDDFTPVIGAAREVRDLLQRTGLTPFVMTTGSSGLHVTVSLDRSADFGVSRDFAQEIATSLADRHPEQYTTEHRKDLRQGRIYFDVRRNAYAQTGIAPYSVRAKPGAPVETPLEWDELGKSGLTPRSYGISNQFRRLAQRDCPWSDLDRHAGSVKEAAKRLRLLQTICENGS